MRRARWRVRFARHKEEQIPPNTTCDDLCVAMSDCLRPLSRHSPLATRRRSPRCEYELLNDLADRQWQARRRRKKKTHTPS
jgi:hypothetical protein